ncbi:MAG: S9 family peptidase [Pseudopedobacter saltans]|uniref:S9 family peptidase n=1 Tax=Pseudopedobacter saltans TaxID=151895 RepID=A0A2W5GCH3_9SPHI|nr:MAG: S9 family peptidase [Pseudopedobacter saltans]
MKKILFALTLVAGMSTTQAQKVLTPEGLWQLGRVSPIGLSKDKNFIVYKVSIPNVQENKSHSKYYKIPFAGGTPLEIQEADTKTLLSDDRISPDGKYKISNEEVALQKVLGKDKYADLPNTTAQVYTSLNYRHWDTWFEGKFNHVFFEQVAAPNKKTDIMKDEPYFCPQQPFGGDEDFIFSRDSKKIIYVTRKEFGTAYAISTNTDIYEYDIASGTTKNLTESNKGYDVAPAFSINGKMAWLQMKTAGYEADKQDLVVMTNGFPVNLTAARDDIHVESFKWSEDGKSLFFTAPVDGTIQVFEVNDIGLTKMLPRIRQITKGDFDINNIVGQKGENLIVAKESMSNPSDLYSVTIKDGKLSQLTDANKEAYASFDNIKTERRWITTSDNKKMMVWIVFPPKFDASKKYPTLLYCQGGPQSPTTQFFSYRWNFQLMASQGYVVVVPCRRGQPGFGTKWNEAVSKDWGGQVLHDYLDAIDNVSKEKYVDTARRAAVGASFGGFSVFALAGMHEGRFKTFIAHDGVFDFRSMYGTTDELWFENWEKGGPYWDKDNKVAQRSFSQTPSNFVDKWNTPIMIVQGGKDFRVPIEQGQQAFQAAQLKGIKSKFLYFPDENHWVLKPQNAQVWQREFFGWLKETL